MKQILIDRVPGIIIMEISDKNYYSSKIIKSLGVTYSHAIKIVNLLEKERIIIKEKVGRRIKIKLTRKGEQIKCHLKSIRELI